MPELICSILKIGKTTYYKYLKNQVPIVMFLLNFSKKELEEFYCSYVIICKIFNKKG